MMQIFDWIPSGAGKLFRPHPRETTEGHIPGSYKWLPVISQDKCTGCAKCVKACDHKCLEMVWDFATLQRAADCGSEGNCMAACPEDVIRMDWVLMTGDSGVGRWRNSDFDSAEAKPAWTDIV